MRLTLITKACLGAVLVDTTVAHPGMSKVLDEIKILQERQGPANPALSSTELIGDLATLQDSELSAVAKDIKATILGKADGENLATYSNVPKLGTAACAQDTCCIWQYIANDMVTSFKGPSGRCTNAARAAVRLGFHDAAGWSKNTGTTGGADGSIILAPEEIRRRDNRGLEEIVTLTKSWYNKYKGYGVSAADLIQMGANVATVVCPLGPRTKTYVGRKDNSNACPAGLLPSVTDSADKIIKLFQDKTIQPNGLTALLGAHSTSQQRFVDPSRAGDPQDSTPGVWDMAYYTELLDPNSPKRVFKFASDIALAADSRIKGLFTAFAASNNAAQVPWNRLYAQEYVRLSLLGVYNINNLTDCTKVLPQPITTFVPQDKCRVDQWMTSTKNVPEISTALLDGKLITSIPNLISLLTGILGGIVSKVLGFFGFSQQSSLPPC